LNAKQLLTSHPQGGGLVKAVDAVQAGVPFISQVGIISQEGNTGQIEISTSSISFETPITQNGKIHFGTLNKVKFPILCSFSSNDVYNPAVDGTLNVDILVIKSGNLTSITSYSPQKVAGAGNEYFMEIDLGAYSSQINGATHLVFRFKLRKSVSDNTIISVHSFLIQ
jgi:hypothetical protein